MLSIDKNNLPELLAPAGSFEHLKTAIKAGADAVYVGGSRFGARAYADNFHEDELVEAIRYCHLYGKKLYLTVNTLMKEQEIEEELYSFILPFYQAGLDGVIIQDLGVVSFLRAHFPNMELHASTQMTISTADGAQAAKRMGMCRIVPARELSIDEIKKIKEDTGLEMEIFIHGALCYCYSGQCLLSSVYGGRSGNRGRCAQPCRLPYRAGDKNGYFLSPKDLCSLDALPELIEAGVDSLKIEGRMKNTDYVAGVVSIYRSYLDYYARLADKKSYHVRRKDVELLTEIFSRDGFTDGYFHKHNGKDMMSMQHPNHLGRKIGTICRIKKNRISIRLEDQIYAKDILVIPSEQKGGDEIILTVPGEMDKMPGGTEACLNAAGTKKLSPGMAVYRRKNTELAKRLEEQVYEKKIKLPVLAQIHAKASGPVTVKLTCDGTEISLSGPVAEMAKGKAITEADIRKQFEKTGNVPFQLVSAEILLDQGIFLPMSAVKKMRQDAYALLEERLSRRQERETVTGAKVENPVRLPNRENCAMIRTYIVITVYNLSMLEQIMQIYEPDAINFPMDFWTADELKEARMRLDRAECKSKKYLSLPRMIRQKNYLQNKKYSRVEELLQPWDGYYVYQINEAELLYRMAREGQISVDRSIVFAASLYSWNHCAVDELLHLYQNTFSHIVFESPAEYSWQESQRWRETLTAIPDAYKEILIYGRYPVMLSAQCIKKNTRKCNHLQEDFTIMDHKGRILPVTSQCGACYNIIWSEKPRDYTEDFQENPMHSRIRFDFYHCEPREIERILHILRSL